MPSATTMETTMSATKRKSAPVKNVYTNESKKPKINSSGSKGSATKTVNKPKVVKQVEETSDPDSNSAQSDGGVPLDNDSSEDEEEGNNSEAIRKVKDGVHPDRAQVVVNNQSSKESHRKQKELAQERKAAKPLADSLHRTKKIWERLRRKSHVPVDERKQLVAELFNIITGSIKDFVLKHDAVRVIQTAIKYANPEQKRLIAKELKGTYRQLAESRYAKFLIGKLLIQGDNEIRDIIVPEFFGHVRRLIKHAEASWILDDIYRGVATRQQKAIILREWYGAEFSLFQKLATDQASSDLSTILSADSSKRAPIMRSLHELINHLIQKKMTGFTLLHDAMLQYFLNVKPGTEEITDFLELLKEDEEGDLLKNLAFTRSGSRVVCLALAYGTAKDRKHIIRAYKDTLQLMAADTNGHIVILAAYEVIDDTVLTSKSIFPELLSKDADKQTENIVYSANDLNARTTLLYLFQGRSKALFPPSLSSDLEILAEIDSIRRTTSKKDPEVRRTELAKALSPYLLRAIAASAANLVATSFGCQFVTEVLFNSDGDKSAALNAVASTAAGDQSFVQPPDVEEGKCITTTDGVQPKYSLASNPYGGRMFKALIAGGKFDQKTKMVLPVVPALNFADVLYPNIQDYIVEWATGSNSFVVLQLLETSTFSNKEEVLQVLKNNKKALERAATEETVEQKARREISEKEKDTKTGNTDKKLKSLSKEREVGNKGAALLLKML